MAAFDRIVAAIELYPLRAMMAHLRVAFSISINHSARRSRSNLDREQKTKLSVRIRISRAKPNSRMIFEIP